MQFPVPQFTDVEDKIIGPLTIKQFGILFGAGILVFLAFSLTKSIIVLVFFGLLIGLPALGLAFAKLNGRPMYNMFGFFYRFLVSPKLLVFHKEGPRNFDFKKDQETKAAEKEAAIIKTNLPVVNTEQRIKDINRILEENENKEQELLKK